MASATGDTEHDAVPVEHVVSLLRERLYGAISCLATLAVLVRYTAGATSAWARVLDVAVATGGLWAASLLADWIAHLGVYGRAPRGHRAARMLQSSAQILEAAFLPLVVLAVAGAELLSTYTAMWIVMSIVVGELGVRAARRAPDPATGVAASDDGRRSGRRGCPGGGHQDHCALR